MSEATFFVRMRGKVSGPYGVDGLRRMVRQGMLSRVHEISADRVVWTRAAEYEELFPSPVTVGAAVAEVEQVGPQEPAPTVVPFAEPPVTGGANYYYSQNGSSIGPVSMSVLHLLAQNGSLGGNELVWRDQAETGVPARQLPLLANLFSSRTATWQETPAAPSITEHQRRDRGTALAFAGSVSAAAGIGAGAVMILSLVLPWLTINDHSVWTWALYHERGAATAAWLCTYLMLAGVALCILAPLTTGTARGICYVSIAGAAVVFTLASMGNESASTAIYASVVPVSLAGLTGVCLARSAAPDLLAGRVLLGIFAGMAIIGLLSSGLMLGHQHDSLEHVPDAIIFGIVLSIIGALAGLAASIMGFVGLKPEFSSALNRTTWILSLIGIGLPLLGAFIAFLGAIDVLSNLVPWGSSSSTLASSSIRAQLSLGIFRVIAIWCAVLTVLITGIWELLLAAAARQR